MKVLLFILIGTVYADVIFTSGISSFSYNADEKYSEAGALLLPDTVMSGLVLLPFNTDKDELAPTLKDQYLYFIERKGKGRKYSGTRVPLEWLAGENGFLVKETWKPYKEEVGMPGNVYLNFSPDGKTVLLNTVDKNDMSKDLYIGDAKTKRKNLNAFPYNGKDYSIGRASISPDGKRLVFSSNMPGSLGGIDLWMSRNENGVWSEPENLGEGINTASDEAMPYFVSNTRLCFASSGRLGFGGYDLFYTDLEMDGSSFPVNMGETVNTKFNEIGICYSPETELLYLASDRRGNYDIYSYRPDIKIAEEKEEIVDVETGNSGLEAFVTHQQTVTEDSVVHKTRIEKSLIIAKEDITDSVFYSVQVMALRASTYSRQHVLQVLGIDDIYVVREDGWTKFRTGRFSSYRKARGYAIKKGIKKFYIVRMHSSQIEEYL